MIATANPIIVVINASSEGVSFNLGDVLILAASVTTGKTIKRAIETVLYYGGTVCGIGSIFSAVPAIAGFEIKTIFTETDVPKYHAYEPADCPMCRAGQKVEALVNSFGYSELK